MMQVTDAKTIWNLLKGVICVFKPAGVSCNQMRKTIVDKISKELCELECRPPIKYVSIEGDPRTKLSVQVKDSYADNPLVTGPRYQPQDIRCTWSSFLSRNTSGVLLLGINDGTKTVQNVCKAKPTRSYRVSGKLGEATDNYFKDGRVVEKSTFHFLTRYHIDKLLSAMQATHQKKMFELCGVDMQSQAAYELAISGLVRPSNSKIPLLYGIKCTHFEAPEFTIETQCISEYELYLKTLIHEIGMQLHTTAHCTSVQCIRHSYFTLEHALLKKHWNLQNIINNLSMCHNILAEHNITRTQKAVLQ